jgi:hypothetical protein
MRKQNAERQFTQPKRGNKLRSNESKARKEKNVHEKSGFRKEKKNLIE